MHVGEVVAVLAAQVAQQLAALAHLGEALRILLDRLADVADLGDDVVELGEQRRRGASATAPNGGRPPSVDQRRGEGVAAAAVVGQRFVRRRAGLAVADGVGEGVLDALEGGVLVGVVELGGRRARRPGTAAGRSPAPARAPPAERGQLGVELGRAGPAPARSGPRSTPPKRSRAARCVGPASRLWWACWPCRSTRPEAASASAPTVVGRPSMYARDRPSAGTTRRQHELVVADRRSDRRRAPRRRQGGRSWSRRGRRRAARAPRRASSCRRRSRR